MAFKIQDTTVIDDNRNGIFANFAQIKKPINQFPANAVTNVNTVATLTTLPYRSLYTSNHTFSRWQVSNNITFSDVYYDSGNTSPTVTFTLPVRLDPLKIYFWRAAFVNEANSVSEFSNTTQFATSNVSIGIPTLQVTGAPNDVLETPTLTTSAFSVTGNASTVVTHQSTDWEVFRTSNNQVVFQRIANTVNLTSIVLPAGTLQGNNQYCFRIRHNANIFGSSVYVSNIANTVAKFRPDTIGESFGGGFYTGTIDIGSNNCYYLIVAPNSTGCSFCQWKCTRSSTVNAASFNNGFSNTYAGLANEAHGAGNWTATRTINGFSDWYLPARDENVVLYTNRGCMPAGEGYDATAAPNCGQYWSSTHQNETVAWYSNFISGTCGCADGFKNFCRRVRAIRRIPIT